MTNDELRRVLSSWLVKHLETDRREALVALRPSVDFDSDGFERRDAENRLRVIRAENHARADAVTLELDLGHADVERDLRPIGQLEDPLGTWFDP